MIVLCQSGIPVGYNFKVDQRPRNSWFRGFISAAVMSLQTLFQILRLTDIITVILLGVEDIDKIFHKKGQTGLIPAWPYFSSGCPDLRQDSLNSNQRPSGPKSGDCATFNDSFFQFQMGIWIHFLLIWVIIGYLKDPCRRPLWSYSGTFCYLNFWYTFPLPKRRSCR